MLYKVYMRKECVQEGAEMWWLESPKQIKIYFVKHDDEISTSAIHIVISLLEPTL